MLLPLPGQGSTIIVSTAYMDEAAKCERLALMDQGRVLKIGSPPELKTPLLGKIFEVRLALFKRGQSWFDRFRVVEGSVSIW